jgi:hypothetical protein
MKVWRDRAQVPEKTRLVTFSAWSSARERYSWGTGLSGFGGFDQTTGLAERRSAKSVIQELR